MTPLPRLLKGITGNGPVRLAEHEAAHGRLPRSVDLAEACERAGLRGHGGAEFPTATKLRAVAAARGRPIVVVNAAEGEPLSSKDRALLEHVPHLVLDGAVAAADAVGADTIVVAVAEGAGRARAGVAAALAERGERVAITISEVPDRFVTGQETALIAALSGREPRPTLTPPRPSDRGLRRRPTLVQNAETLAHLALVARGDHGKSTLVTLSGCVAAPGVHEIRPATGLRDLVSATGGWSEPARAVLIGGYHGTWVDPDYNGHARRGAGVVCALPSSVCPVAEVARVMRWMAGETAGQCGPCVHGLAAIADEVEAIRIGAAGPDAMRRLRRWSGELAGRGACHHPDGSTRFLASALDVFEAELEMHRRFGACETCHAPAVMA